MRKQYIINVNTDESTGPAVQTFDTSHSPITTPPIGANCVPVADYDSAEQAIKPIIDAINYAMIEAVRGS